MGKIVDALRKIGFDYVFDTAFSADLTIMEEGAEFLERLQNGELKDRPMFTSCCPGCIRLSNPSIRILCRSYPAQRSPQQMFVARHEKHILRNPSAWYPEISAPYRSCLVLQRRANAIWNSSMKNMQDTMWTSC